MSQIHFRTVEVVPGNKSDHVSGGEELNYTKSVIFPTNIIRVSNTLSGVKYGINTELPYYPTGGIPNRIQYDIIGEVITGGTYDFTIFALFGDDIRSLFGNNGQIVTDGYSVNLLFSITAVCEDSV